MAPEQVLVDFSGVCQTDEGEKPFRFRVSQPTADSKLFGSPCCIVSMPDTELPDTLIHGITDRLAVGSALRFVLIHIMSTINHPA